MSKITYKLVSPAPTFRFLAGRQLRATVCGLLVAIVGTLGLWLTTPNAPALAATNESAQPAQVEQPTVSEIAPVSAATTSAPVAGLPVGECKAAAQGFDCGGRLVGGWAQVNGTWVELPFVPVELRAEVK